MEPEESFYGQAVVWWSCLRIAVISINFWRYKEREKSHGILRHNARWRQRDKEKREKSTGRELIGTVERYPGRNATTPFGIVVPLFVCFSLIPFTVHLSCLHPEMQQDFNHVFSHLLSCRIVSRSSFCRANRG